MLITKVLLILISFKLSRLDVTLISFPILPPDLEGEVIDQAVKLLLGLVTAV